MSSRDPELLIWQAPSNPPIQNDLKSGAPPLFFFATGMFGVWGHIGSPSHAKGTAFGPTVKVSQAYRLVNLKMLYFRMKKDQFGV